MDMRELDIQEPLLSPRRGAAALTPDIGPPCCPRCIQGTLGDQSTRRAVC